MPTLSLRKRLLIALTGYGVLLLSIIAFLVLRRFEMGVSVTQKMILSAVVAVPLLLALLWEHLKGLKVGQVEITLNDVTPTIDVELAAAIQDLQGSGTATLVQAVSSLIGRKDLKLVEVNLRSSPYWWSTRVYLLAALAVEYANIERLVFVEQDAARLFVGTAAPTAVRSALGQKFPDLEYIFAEVLRNVRGHGLDPASQVQSIGFAWSSHSFQPGGTQHTAEVQVRELVTSTKLMELLGSALETESREWKGESPNYPLYARILSCKVPFVPLLNRRRLEKVVDRFNLAVRLAISVVS